MNIGLLTYHSVANFGANLQTLSTIGYLRKAGHNPIVINWVPDSLTENYIKNTLPAQLEAHRSFQSYYGNISPICKTKGDIVNVIRKYSIDTVLIGSDAVLSYIPIWDRLHLITRYGPRYVKPLEDWDFPIPFWGDFLDEINVPTSLMSASAQNTNYSHIYFRKKEFARKLGQFKHITVRDKWTADMIIKLSNGNINPAITPDPVFAFNQNIDDSLVMSRKDIIDKYNLPGNYVLISLFKDWFGQEWLDRLQVLFHKENIQLVSLPKANYAPYQASVDINLSLPIPPLDWYYLIKYANGYIGELMHPLLVSLHNSVPVFSVDTYGFAKRGNVYFDSSKILHVMGIYGLLDNVYHTKSNCCKPSADFVFDKIINFDRDHCAKVSKQRLEEYNKMMNDLIN